MKRTELRLPDEIYEELRDRAYKSRISLNQIICLLLTQALQPKKYTEKEMKKQWPENLYWDFDGDG
jgi:predicted HicB family RNase H-like nuclease